LSVTRERFVITFSSTPPACAKFHKRKTAIYIMKKQVLV